MPRRWNPSFVNDYAKLRNRIDRDYGERAYTDKFKIESSPGMLHKQEPDYNIHFKPYQPDNNEHKTLSLETTETPAERSESTPPIQTYSKEPQPIQNNPIENELAKMESEVIPRRKSTNPLESVEKQESPC